MITVDVNGNALTAAYDSIIKGDNRRFLARLMMDGSEISCAIKRIEVTKGSCGDEQFSVGNLISSSMTAEVFNLTDDVKGKTIELQIGLLTDEENDTYTYIEMGEFVVSEAKKRLNGATITAHGRLVANSATTMNPTLAGLISNAGKGLLCSFGRLVAGAPVSQTVTLAELGAMAARKLGCPVQFDSAIDPSVSISKPLNGMTTYEVLQIMASVIGGYAVDTHDGKVKFYKFGTTPTLECDAGQMVTLPDMEEQDFEITGIRVTVATSAYDDDGLIPAITYSEGTDINLDIENEYVKQDTFNEMSYLVGYTYRPGFINLSLGDPRLEGNDILQVTDADGSVYIVPCHQVKHTYDGGFFSEITAVRPTDLDSNIGTKTPLQQTLETIKTGMVSVKTAVEKVKTIAGDTAQFFWNQATGTDTGAHITEIPKDEFLQDPEHGGGNILMRSNGMAVRDGLTELATFGADGSVTGQQGQSRQEMNYHAMKMIDADGNEYLHFSDLRDANGRYSAADTFTGDGTNKDFRLTWDSTQGITVTVDGIQTTDFTTQTYDGYVYVTMDSAPEAGATVLIAYQTTSSLLKAFTLGTRAGSIGAYSTAIGSNNEASGRYAQAFGKDLKAEGESTTVIGKKNYTTDGAFVIGNGDSTESDALKVDWNGNLSISGTLSQASDKNLKAHVDYLGEDAIELIRGLKPAAYLMYGKPHAGFYAQEVPDRWSLVSEFNGHLSLDYLGLIAPLVKYCQHLEERIEKLEGK